MSLTEGKFTPITRVKGKAKLEGIAPTRMIKARNVCSEREKGKEVKEGERRIGWEIVGAGRGEMVGRGDW